MTSLFELACAAERTVPRSAIAATANLWFWLKGASSRHFGVDPQGRWVNQQPEVTFVSPDIYTTHFEQVKARVLDEWCHLYTPKQGDVVVDVGAGIGEETVLFSKLVGSTGRVFSIEAHPATFGCLAASVSLSDLSNVITEQCALSDHDGEIAISNCDEHIANSLVDGKGGLRVRARSLDSLLDDFGNVTVDFLKMNIEGAERAAMYGMAKTARNIRNVAIECHDFVADRGGGDGFRTREFVIAALEGFGFDVQQRANPMTPWMRDRIYGRRA